MMTRITRILAGGIGAAAFALHAAGVAAQSPNPLIDGIKSQYGVVKGYLTKSLEKVPEDVVAFKPTPDVAASARSSDTWPMRSS